MFVIGFCIHLIFLFSVFDIYFKSPIVHNVTPFTPQHESVADRLILFVVDGLRAESFVNYTTMPYLRFVANSHGRWGISNTRVPTESRPGHVAIIAGFYEDPSAIAKGWKENPVDFDSVFNQTSYTWCWGAYDIIDIFTKDNNHIIPFKFDPYDQSFSTNKNTTLLDSWVFENVKDLLNKAEKDIELHKKLKQKKILFFLHLLGTDTSGHTHKPQTNNYLTTLRFVDEGIKNIEATIRNFYNDDGKTAFLMTADHGMTDWGSHGAGDEHETKTPYVLWGAGVLQTKMKTFDTQTNSMSLDHKFDVNQADLAPLMSTILSIPVPVNSIGQAPIGLLNMSIADKAKALYSNSRQLASQYNRKRLNVEANAIPLLYKPYEQLDQKKYDEIISFSEQMLSNEEYDKLIILSKEISHLSLTGLEYYHNYYQRPLQIFVTLSFVGWMACLLTILFRQKMSTDIDTTNDGINRILNRVNICNMAFLLFNVISSYLVYAQNLPIQYYLYFVLPIILWWYVFSSQNLWRNIFINIWRNGETMKLSLEILCYLSGCVAMGLSFSYRWMLSIPLLGMGVWPLITSKTNQLSTPILFVWLLGCILLSVFSFVPVVGKKTFIELVIVGGLLWLIFIGGYIWKLLLPLYYSNKEEYKELYITVFQIVLLIISMYNIYVQAQKFDNSLPVSHFLQVLSWIITVASCLSVLFHSTRMICRLMAVYTSILNIYLLLSVSHEGLFMVSLISNLACWIIIEFRLLYSDNIKMIDTSFSEKMDEEEFIQTVRAITKDDFRRAFFFLLYIILAFFGTGNIASLNSFEVRWVTCFITSYHPFIITGLILLKTLLPFLCVACSFRAVQNITNAPSGYLNIIVLIYSNIIGVQLLYNVKNTGSWLEIGTSISQFVIIQVITLFIVLINQIAKMLTDVSFYSFKIFKNRKKYV